MGIGRWDRYACRIHILFQPIITVLNDNMMYARIIDILIKSFLKSITHITTSTSVHNNNNNKKIEKRL